MPTQPKRQIPARTAGSTSQSPNSEKGTAVETPSPEMSRAEQPRPEAPRRPGEGLNITTLKDMSIQRLTQIAKDMSVAGATGMRKQELIFQILKAQTEQSGS